MVNQYPDWVELVPGQLYTALQVREIIAVMDVNTSRFYPEAKARNSYCPCLHQPCPVKACYSCCSWIISHYISLNASAQPPGGVDVGNSEYNLRNVIRSVTFPPDFRLEVHKLNTFHLDDPNHPHNRGVLCEFSQHYEPFIWRILYDMTFYIVLIIIVLNLVFGVIIDIFGDLRAERMGASLCCATIVSSAVWEGAVSTTNQSFLRNTAGGHNLWHYLHFINLLQFKDKTVFTGPESYVAKCVKGRNLDWFPQMQAISLKEDDNAGDSEHFDLRDLKEKIRQNQNALKELGQRHEIN